MGVEEDLFNSDLPEIDGLQIINIDLDGIDQLSKDDAVTLIHNLSNFYYDEDFMRRNPNFKKRVDAELESLRILFKMRRTDEETHDILIKAIEGNSGNASLYKSLTEMQKTIISITSKIGDIIDKLNGMMKNYQLELNFNKEEDEEQEEMNTSDLSSKDYTTRGSKEFIEKMNSAWEAGEQTELLFQEEEDE